MLYKEFINQDSDEGDYDENARVVTTNMNNESVVLSENDLKL